jgi:hypothetical protein
MAAGPFEVSVRFRPGVASVDLRGELDATGEDALNAVYGHASSRSPDILCGVAPSRWLRLTAALQHEVFVMIHSVDRTLGLVVL